MSNPETPETPTVERFDMECSQAMGCAMEPWHEGEWVRYEDYARLQQAHASLQEERDVFLGLLSAVNEEIAKHVSVGPNEPPDEYVRAAYERAAEAEAERDTLRAAVQAFMEADIREIEAREAYEVGDTPELTGAHFLAAAARHEHVCRLRDLITPRSAQEDSEP